MVREYDVAVGEQLLGVRESGVANGRPVLHFHGTPGSRLALAWADELVAAEGIRLVAFDRPGYGRAPAAPFSVASIGALAVGLADAVGMDRFATFSWSGGAPFALATAAAAGPRVTAVGVASGAGPFQHVPGALESLSEVDAEALTHLPRYPATAAEHFASGFPGPDDFTDVQAMYAFFEPALSPRDRVVVTQPPFAQGFLADLREALAQGLLGGGWDNVAWVGEWDLDLASVRCPVHLWYGDEDRMAPPAHGQWLADHLPDAHLTLEPGFGHMLLVDRLPQMLRRITE